MSQPILQKLRQWLTAMDRELLDETDITNFAALRVKHIREAAERIEELESIVDRIPADRLNPWHTVTVHSAGWHMAHPIDCLLADCPFDGLAQAEWTDPPTAEGVWQWHAFEDEPWDWTEVLPKL